MKESKFIDHTNKKWFWAYLNDENQVGEVCKYLADNNLKIEIKGSSTGSWDDSGVSVLLEGIDLSGNGFCFSGSNLLIHVRYFRKLKEKANTDEFKCWLQQYHGFNLVKRYIVEKDQRWITENELKEFMKD